MGHGGIGLVTRVCTHVHRSHWGHGGQKRHQARFLFHIELEPLTALPPQTLLPEFKHACHCKYSANTWQLPFKASVGQEETQRLREYLKYSIILHKYSEQLLMTTEEVAIGF